MSKMTDNTKTLPDAPGSWLRTLRDLAANEELTGDDYREALPFVIRALAAYAQRVEPDGDAIAALVQRVRDAERERLLGVLGYDGTGLPDEWDQEGLWVILRFAYKSPMSAGVDDIEGQMPHPNDSALIAKLPALIRALRTEDSDE